MSFSQYGAMAIAFSLQPPSHMGALMGPWAGTMGPYGPGQDHGLVGQDHKFEATIVIQGYYCDLMLL